MNKLNKSLFLFVLAVLILILSFTATAKDTEIVMVATPQGDKIFEAIIPQFEKANPGITVQYTSLPREQFDACGIRYRYRYVRSSIFLGLLEKWIPGRFNLCV